MSKWFRRALALLVLAALLAPAAGYCTASASFLRPGSMETLLRRYDLYSGALTIEAIDFASMTPLESEEALLRFLLDCQDALVRQVPVLLPHYINIYSITESNQFFDWASVTVDSYLGTGKYLLTFSLNPGARIAYAYLMHDTSRLTKKELVAYWEIDLFFSLRYPWRADAVTRERCIHDFVGNACEYWTDDGAYYGGYSDFRSVVGVFVDGKANCSGVADAFHILCRIAGFQERRVIGSMYGQPHTWNAIHLEGKWYMVDATNNGLVTDLIPYMYFNAGTDLMAQSHAWDANALSLPVEKSIDRMYAYGNPAFPELVRVAEMNQLTDAIVGTAKRGSGIRQTLLCDAFIGNVETFLEQTIETLRLSLNLGNVNCTYQQETLGGKLYLNITITY